MDLFSIQESGNSVFRLDMADAEVAYYPFFFSKEESDRLFQVLLEQMAWKQDRIKLYGREMPIPRMAAWYGDTGKSYTYSGIQMHPHSWTPALLDIKTRIEAVAGVQFSSVLLNLYRNGADSMGWHADDEKELGQNPIIGSVSLGATRSFQFKHRTQPQLRTKIDLQHGSFLLMGGPTQHHWLHQIPKTAKPVGPRINLTFRIIL